MRRPSKAEGRFVREGLNSYLRVLESVEAFENKIFTHCQKHVRDQLPKLRGASGATFDVKGIKRSHRLETYGAYIEAGVQNARDYFSVGIWFGKDGNRVNRVAYAAMYFPSKKSADMQHERLHGRGFSAPEEWENDWYINAEVPIEKQDTNELNRALKKAAEKWSHVADKMLSARRK